MHRTVRTVLLALFSICITLSTAGQQQPAVELPEEIRFEHLGIPEGLSSSSVSKIVQDRRGFIWFATHSGLNKYDGLSVDRYTYDPFNRNSLSHNLIQTMFYEEKTDRIWIGTYGGLNLLDTADEEFTWYTHESDDPGTLSNNVVVAIERSVSGELWVGTLRGLNRFDEETGRFERYMQGEPDDGDLPNDVIRSLAVDGKGTLWIGSYGGLSRYLPEQDAFETFEPAESSAPLPSPYVMYILPDPENENMLWLGMWDGGISRVNTLTGEVTTTELPHNQIYTMMFDSRGRLWVGTWGNGLYVMDPQTGTYTKVRSASQNPEKQISGNVIYSVIEDESGIIWVGTNGSGVHKFVPWENRFNSYVHDAADPSSISDGKTTAIHFDEDGTGWFGTYSGGLNRLDPESEEFVHYRHDSDNSSSMSNNIVNDIYRDSKGNLWIGTNKGLNRYLPEKDAFERIYAGSGEYTPPEDVVFEISEGPEGALWLGTNTSGIAIYDYETGKYRVLSHKPEDPHSLSDNLVRTILHDSRGETWVGTNDGVNKYERESDDFIRYTHSVDDPGTISGDNIREIHEDAEGRIWIATMGGGISRYHRESDSFSYLTTRDGLVSNQVFGILEGEGGKLWFPTNRGISIYDPRSDNFRTLNKANGLLSTELTKASTQDPGGKFYFGSAEGVTVIPELLHVRTDYLPPVVLTEFSVLGEERDIKDTSSRRYGPVSLDYDDSYFSFEFAVLDYASPEQNKYAYMLEGFDEEWKQSDERNFGEYTNLDPGSYTLKIKGAGSRGNWNERGISVPLTVARPWWSTGYAYGLYAVLFALLLLLIYYRIRKRRLEAEARIEQQERINRELDRKVQERTAEIEKSKAMAERATEAKTIFLANMSHEIRTPLNGLIGMLSLLSKTPLEESQKEYVKYSKISAENLNTLVNDLLDFERIEAGELKLAHERFSISEVIAYLQRLFSGSCEEKNLGFDTEILLGDASDTVRGDRNRVVQLLTNLVSNAVKYTHEGGITVRVPAKNSASANYVFEVEDTGAGISPENLESIFDRFKQLDSGYTKSARGVGLGLAIVKQVSETMGGEVSLDSQPGRGTTFRISLPLETVESGKQPESEEIFEQNKTAGPAESSETPAETNAGQAAGEETGQAEASERTADILVCEDEGINRLYISRYLKGLGYSVDEARDGLESVEKAKKNRYGLILMDLGMPHISGLEAAERIRRWERENRRKAEPILALSAHTYEDDIRRCRDAGMNDFVSKPIKEAELERAVKKWL